MKATARQASGSRRAPLTASRWELHAQHVGAALVSPAVPEATRLALVAETLAYVIRHLEAVEPSGQNLADPDYGVVYYLYYKDRMRGRDLAALHLLRRCLAIQERRDFSTADRIALLGDIRAMAGAYALAEKAGAAGGRRSGRTRKATSLNPMAVEAAARKLGWPIKTRGVYKRLSLTFDCTPERIGQILREQQSTK